MTNQTCLLSSLDKRLFSTALNLIWYSSIRGQSLQSNGHKYIRQFDCNIITRTVYRVGSVILSKERMLVSFEPWVIIKYTLLDAHSPPCCGLDLIAFRIK